MILRAYRTHLECGIGLFTTLRLSFPTSARVAEIDLICMRHVTEHDLSRADIVFINPRFEISYWGMEFALPFIGKRANLPVACLPLLAALTPGEHTVTLIDENVEPIDWELCEQADIVGITGMSVQPQPDEGECSPSSRRRGAVSRWPAGPGSRSARIISATSSTRSSSARPRTPGRSSWPSGSRGSTRSATSRSRRPDMSKVPPPRFDLLKMGRATRSGACNSPAGCPFQCEFCDIIVTFGRRPEDQDGRPRVLAELDAIHAAKMPIVFIVDDNLIGNKKAIKEVLKDVIVWQQKYGYPLTFFTEASIDLADDPELLDLMVEANFIATFIGIESPGRGPAPRGPRNTQKRRAGGTLLEKVHRIQEKGIEVWCGMIMGFDSDDPGIFDRQIDFIRQARISFSMSGMLSAIPKTPLYDRLAGEGRLDPSDMPEFGTNVIPQRMSREELLDGYIRVLDDPYTPEAFFGRLDDLVIKGRLDMGRGRSPHCSTHPMNFLYWQTLWTVQSIGALRPIDDERIPEDEITPRIPPAILEPPAPSLGSRGSGSTT